MIRAVIDASKRNWILKSDAGNRVSDSEEGFFGDLTLWLRLDFGDLDFANFWRFGMFFGLCLSPKIFRHRRVPVLGPILEGSAEMP
jgi:hypothetical protein